MIRSELTETVERAVAQGAVLKYVKAATVYVHHRNGGGLATLYRTPTGTDTWTQPLTSNYGRVEPTEQAGADVWLDAGDYYLLVTKDDETWTQRFTATAGSHTEQALEQIKDWLTTPSTDSRGETFPNGLRRWLKLTRPHFADETAAAAARMPGAVELYLGQRESANNGPIDLTQDVNLSEEDSDDVWFNSTAASLSTLFVANYALYMRKRPDLVAAAERFARTLLKYQWTGVPNAADPMLRRGGFMLGASDGRTGSFGTGLAVRALLQAHKATGTVGFLNAAIDGCDYLMRLADPNPYWEDAYGVTPINRTVGDVTWYGFCDRVDSLDKISTVSTTWNLVAARSLYEVGNYIGGDQGDSYVTVAEQARDFMAPAVLNGYDFFAVQTNIGSVELNTAVLTSDTAIHLDVTSPVPLPTSYPFSLVFAGETMIVTGAPTGDSYPVTRSSSPRAFAVGRQAVVLDDYVTASWTLSTTNVWNDHSLHRLGDSGNPRTGSVGTDQIEYGIACLYAIGYDVDDLRACYEHFRDLPHSGALLVGPPIDSTYSGENADGGVFGSGYNGAISFAGLFRLDRFDVNGRVDAAVGGYYDIQGAGTLGPFKALEYPADFELSRTALEQTIYRGSLLNKDLGTVWSLGTTEDTTKRGAIVVASAAEALLAALEGRP